MKPVDIGRNISATRIVCKFEYILFLNAVEVEMPEQFGFMHLVRIVMLITFFVFISVRSDLMAEDAPAKEPNPAAKTVTDDGQQIENESALEKTFDETHALIERNILDQVIRFDDFFGNIKTEDKRLTRYQLRWRNSVRIEQGGRLKFGTTLRTNIVLSKISERLRLVISGENEPDPFAPSLPEDPGNPGYDRTFRSTRLVNTEVRYGILQTPELDVFLGTGVRFVLPFEVFARSRFQYTHHFSDIILGRFGETLFVKNTSGLGETTEIDLERMLNRKTLLRWSSSGTVSQYIDGMEWGSELSLIRELSQKSAITLTGGVYGTTNTAAVVSNYRVLTRYRQNFLRSWLFYEVEPEISWPRDANGRYNANLALTFRLEVVFEGVAAKKGKPSSTP